MGNEPEHRAGGKPTALRSVPWQRHHRGSWAPAFFPLIFPANAGTQRPRSSGCRPKGHRTTTASAARSVLFFQESPSIVLQEISRRLGPFHVSGTTVTRRPPPS